VVAVSVEKDGAPRHKQMAHESCASQIEFVRESNIRSLLTQRREGRM